MNRLVSIGGGHMGAHGCAIKLEEVMGIEGEEVVDTDKLCEDGRVWGSGID